MKAAVLGALTGAGLVIAAVGVCNQGSEVFAQPTASAYRTEAGDALIAVPAPIGENGQLLTVIDPKQRVMSVYHIELPSGRIALRSVRNIRWDLQMTEFNGQSPLPQEIRALLLQR